MQAATGPISGESFKGGFTIDERISRTHPFHSDKPIYALLLRRESEAWSRATPRIRSTTLHHRRQQRELCNNFYGHVILQQNHGERHHVHRD